ncbi:MAG: hypothetical protein RBJ76_03675 [Stenomitos frigidus ULC029]
MYAIDANFRINGSTPLCLQWHQLLKCNKAIVKYSSDHKMDGTLDFILIPIPFLQATNQDPPACGFLIHKGNQLGHL